jgi:signal transduction histidine kinase/CheY-like chemotaxis protein/tetratricopeptide (TPR) repeat protein
VVKLLQEHPGDELRSLRRAVHPAIPRLLGTGTLPSHWVAMELAAGGPLSGALGGPAISLPMAMQIAAWLMDALACAHHAGVLHGDVKPANIVLSSLQPVRLTLVDFGMAGQAHGGTPAYAAPELLHGTRCEASDVYSAALVLWEFLHGALPYAELGALDAMLMRRDQEPEPTEGPQWLRELLRACLNSEPGLRPTAGQVADQLAAQGATLPELTPAILTRRARATHLQRPNADSALSSWMEHGGACAIVGPAGTGRTHNIDRVHSELNAAGRAVVRLHEASTLWAPVQQALRDPALVGPPAALPTEASLRARAVAAAEALLARSSVRVAVLADDLDLHDAGTQAFVQALATEGRCDVLLSGASSVPWANCVPLEPLSLAGLQGLAAALLPGLVLSGPILTALDARGPQAAQALVEALAAALKTGDLQRPSGRWVLVEPATLERLRTAVPVALNMGAAATRMLRLLAVAARPLPRADALALSGLASADGALTELEDLGALRVSAAGVRATQAPAGPIAPKLAAQVLAHARANHWPDTELGRLIVVARDRRAAARDGARCVDALGAVSPSDAAALAGALWELAQPQSQDLALARMRALNAAADPSAACAFAATVAGFGPAQHRLLVELARAESALDQTNAALATLGRARLQAPPSLDWYQVIIALHTRLGRTEEAQRLIDESAHVASDGPDDDTARLRILLSHAQLLATQGQVDRGIELLSALPATLGAGTVVRAQASAALGRLLVHGGKLTRARRVLDASASDPALPLLDRGRTLINLGMVLYMLEDRLRAIAAWEGALLSFERLDIVTEQVRARINLCLAYRENGQRQRALEAGRWAVSNAERAGLDADQAVAAGNLGEALAGTDPKQALFWYAHAQDLAQRCGLSGELVELSRRRAELAARSARSQAREAAHHARTTALAAGDTIEANRAAMLLILAQARAGVCDDVPSAVHAALAPLRTSGLGVPLAWSRVWGATACLEVGASQLAGDLARRALSFAREVHHEELVDAARQITQQLAPVREFSDVERSLDRLLDLSQTLGVSSDLDETLAQVASAALELLPDADRAFVSLGPDASIAARATRGLADDLPPSRSVLLRTLDAGRDVLVTDLYERGDLAAAQSILSLRLRSVLCVPLLDRGQALGALYVDSHRASSGDLRRMERVLRVLATIASTAVVRARLSRQEAAQEQVREKLEHALADAVRATDAKGRFLATMSHELRTPLNGVLGMLDLLSLSRLSAEQHQMLETIQGSSQTLLGLIEQVLSYARLESGAERTRDTVFDLRGLVEDVVGLVSGSADAQGLELVADVHPSLWAHRVGDSGRLQQVLVNLLGNAARFTQTGGTVVGVRPFGRSQVRFELIDTGPGIPADALDTIFDPFTQADQTDRRRHGGAGLGLSIARETVRLLGGTLACTSELGQGSTFFFTLPLPEAPGDTVLPWVPLDGISLLLLLPFPPAEAALRSVLEGWGAQVATDWRACPDPDLVLAASEDPRLDALSSAPVLHLHPPGSVHVGVTRPIRAAQLANALSETLALSRMDRPDGLPAAHPRPDAHVLLVEDNPVNRVVAQRMLQELGLRVSMAEDGAQAVAALENGPFDAVLMDCQLPVLDGYGATRALRLLPHGRAVPVLALTARAMPGDRKRCLEAGMNDYLTKPITLDGLRIALARWIP